MQEVERNQIHTGVKLRLHICCVAVASGFVAHPFQVYTLPLKRSPEGFALMVCIRLVRVLNAVAAPILTKLINGTTVQNRHKHPY